MLVRVLCGSEYGHSLLLVKVTAAIHLCLAKVNGRIHFRKHRRTGVKRREGLVLLSADGDAHQSTLVVVVASLGEATGQGLDVVLIDIAESDGRDADLRQRDADTH